MDEEQRLAAEIKVRNAYRNGVRDLLELVVAHATVTAMVGRAEVRLNGQIGEAAAAVAKRTMAAWFSAMDAIPEEVSLAIFTATRPVMDDRGREAPVCGGPPA